MPEPREAHSPGEGRGAQTNTHRRSAAAIIVAAAGTLLTIGLAGTLLRPPGPLLLWNASPSSPVGLYAIGSSDRLRTGDIAIAWPPPEARRLAARRHYLPANVPLVKTVAATSGARLCGLGRRITVDGRAVALRRSSDPSGRPLPWWSGCMRLRPGEVFLLSPGVSQAYDGRYFGATRASQIIGSGTLLWPR